MECRETLRVPISGIVRSVPSLTAGWFEPSLLIACSHQPLDDQARKPIADAVSIGPGSTFDHDPRFGLILMGEIAARSLSAAVNDPGTIFDVTATGVKVLGRWSRALNERDAKGGVANDFDHVTARAVREAGMLGDVFAPIARCGAPAVEIGIKLRQALRSLQRLEGDIPKAALEVLDYPSPRAAHAGLADVDLAPLTRAAQR